MLLVNHCTLKRSYRVSSTCGAESILQVLHKLVTSPQAFLETKAYPPYLERMGGRLCISVIQSFYTDRPLCGRLQFKRVGVLRSRAAATMEASRQRVPTSTNRQRESSLTSQMVLRKTYCRLPPIPCACFKSARLFDFVCNHAVAAARLTLLCMSACGPLMPAGFIEPTYHTVLASSSCAATYNLGEEMSVCHSSKSHGFKL